jgi:hypothetical protein
MAKKDDKKLVLEARERFKRCVDSDQDNRRKSVEDLKFIHVPGEQWDAKLKEDRGIRPNYEFNKLRVTIKRIVNDIRANRPQAKVRAVEDGDKDTASVLEGLCRNIWTVSDADAAVDIAAEYSVGGGMGAWRVVTDYADDSAWDQDIRIVPIRNPLSLWCDPAAKDPMKRDARYWFLESKMSKDAYKDKYGKVPAVDWDASEFADADDWEDEDSVRICEYWYQKPVKKTLALLDDGSTVDVEDTDPQMLFTVDPMTGQPVSRIRRTREVQAQQICMAIIGGGDKVIEPPTEWAGAKFPFVQVYGEYVVIDGKVHWFGLTRFAKDAQRSYNYSRTLAVEAIALAPQAKIWATPEQADGHTANWGVAHKQNLPYMLYNATSANPNPPQRVGGADVPVALIQEMQIASDDIKSVTGIFDNSLGQKANEASGVAIRARQAQGEIATFNYADNIARAVRYTHELLVDLIPKIYDAERSIRILGADGAEQYAKVNEVGPDGQVKNDLSRGKYDVSVTVGPNMGTQRQEAAEVYMGLMQGNPGLFPIVGDLVVKTFDYPYSDEMAERLRLMAPPQIQQMLAQKEQNGGKAMDPQAQAAMAQAEQIMAQVQEMSQVVQQAAQEAEGIKAEAEKGMVELNSAKATLEADYQKMLADLAKREAQLILKDASLTAAQTQQGVDDEGKKVEGERETLTSNLDSAIKEMQAEMKQQAADFMTQAAQVLAQIQANAQAEKPPRNKSIRVKRVNGELVGMVEEQ